MRCAEARDVLLRTAVDGTVAPAVARHVEECPLCAAFATRQLTVRAGLRARHADHRPGPEFAARVSTSLPGTTELIGWAALRLLPMALALTALLSWYGLSRGPGLSDLLLRPDDPQLLTYVALAGESR